MFIVNAVSNNGNLSSYESRANQREALRAIELGISRQAGGLLFSPEIRQKSGSLQLAYTKTEAMSYIANANFVFCAARSSRRSWKSCGGGCTRNTGAMCIRCVSVTAPAPVSLRHGEERSRGPFKVFGVGVYIMAENG